MSQLKLAPISKISGSCQLPGSKSISNRLLLLSVLAQGNTTLQNLLRSDDIHHMLEAMKVLKIEVQEHAGEIQGQSEFTVEGIAGEIPVSEAKLFLGNAGTAIRPLTAALTLGKGHFILDGNERMRERPILDLVEALQQLNVSIQCMNNTDCPPVEIHANGLSGGTVRLRGSISSQYLTALLITAPYAQQDVHLKITDTLVSKPYVAMTLALMERFGVSVEHDNMNTFHIKGRQCYQSPGKVYVEGDASSASYFLAGAAITGGTVTVKGCGTKSIQGDSRFAELLEKMGATVTWEDHAITVTGTGTLNAVDVDMNDMTDAAMTLAILAIFASGTTTIRNIYNWRLKETNRIAAVAAELRKLGASVEEGRDFIVITPPEKIQSAAIDTYDDHRMAMAFSLAACGDAAITINDPECVSKTFPNYFEVLSELSEC